MLTNSEPKFKPEIESSLCFLEGLIQMEIGRRIHGVTTATNHGIEKRHAGKSMTSLKALRRTEVMAEHFKP